eukprot:308930-Karenia_brevis.AAC.1
MRLRVKCLEEKFYNYKQIAEVKLPPFPNSGGELRQWIERVISAVAWLDISKLKIIIRWLKIPLFPAGDTGVLMNPLSLNGQCLEIFDTLMARLIESHADFAKCKYYEDFLLYTKAAHQLNDTTKFRVLLLIITGRHRMIRHRANYLSSRVIFRLSLDGFGYNKVKQFYDRITAIMMELEE